METANLDVYPNPSRDVFNVTFTSEIIQDLKVRVLNVVGEEVVSEVLENLLVNTLSKLTEKKMLRVFTFKK